MRSMYMRALRMLVSEVRKILGTRDVDLWREVDDPAGLGRSFAIEGLIMGDSGLPISVVSHGDA